MKLFLFSAVVFVLAALGMALGLFFGRAPIRTCGGLPCELCDKKRHHRRRD